MYGYKAYMYRIITSMLTFQNILTNFIATTWSYNPIHAVTHMVWAIPVARHYWGIIIYFLSYRY